MLKMNKSMIKILLLLFAVNLPLFAYSDSDFDGVDDKKDLCPNTSFDLIVDNNGCPQRKSITLLLGEDISQGKYGGTEDINSLRTTAFIAYNIGLWGYALSTSNVETTTSTTSTSGMGDVYTTLSYYGLGSKKNLFSLQVGAKIATADVTLGTGENDYNCRLSSVIITKNLSYLSSVGYTITGDTSTTSYNDMVNVALGVGKQLNRDLYMSTSVNYVSAYVDSVDAAMSAMLYVAYTLSDSWFWTASYTYGLSDAVADHGINLSLGIKL